MDTQRITLKQAFWLFVNSRFIITLVFIPQFTELSSPMDVLPALFLNLPMDLLFTVVFLTLWLQYPNRTLIEYSESIAGKWLGKSIGMLYILYFVIQMCVTVRIFNEFMSTRFFPNTPVEIIGFGLLAIAAYSVCMGLETLGRCAETLVPIIFMGVLLLVVLASPNAVWYNVLPTWERGVGELLISDIPSMTRWNDVAWMAMIVPYICDNRKTGRIVIGGVVFLRVIWLLLMVPLVAIFGSDLLPKLQFPTFELVQIISIGDFLERIDALVLGLWVAGAFLKIGILYYVTVLAASQWFGMKSNKSLIFPVGFLVMIMSLLLFSNIVELKSFGKEMAPVDFIFAFMIPLLLATIHFMKQRQRAHEAH